MAKIASFQLFPMTNIFDDVSGPVHQPLTGRLQRGGVLLFPFSLLNVDGDVVVLGGHDLVVGDEDLDHPEDAPLPLLLVPHPVVVVHHAAQLVEAHALSSMGRERKDEILKTVREGSHMRQRI